MDSEFIPSYVTLVQTIELKLKEKDIHKWPWGKV